MAKVINLNRSLVSGKVSKKDREIHRVRDGKEQLYTIDNEYEGPPSEAQTAHRSNFGRVNAIVNRIMADPVQVAELQERMNAANKAAFVSGQDKPFKTVRQFAYALVLEQIELTPPPPTQLPKGYKLHIRTFADLSASELYEILKARYAVFTREQGIIYLDEDDIDYLATHVYITRGTKVIAYARLFREKAETTFDVNKYEHVSNDSIFCIGRMLTTVRHQGFGARLIHSLIAETRRQGARTLRLHAQLHAVPFYEQFGFHTVGDTFEEANIPHICMEMTL